MKERPFRSIEEHFEEISDPRQGKNVQHKLLEIIIIAICGVICGADGWVEIENFGCQKAICTRIFATCLNTISATIFKMHLINMSKRSTRDTDGLMSAIAGLRMTQSIWPVSGNITSGLACRASLW